MDAQLASTGRPLAPPGEDITVVQTYEAPRSLAEAVALLRAGNVTVVAGGTDLMPQSKTGRARFQPVLMNVQRIPELRGIGETDGCVRFGALTTVTELLEQRNGQDAFQCALAGRRSLRQRSAAQRGHHRRQYLQCLAGGRHPGAAARVQRSRRAGERGERRRYDAHLAARRVLRRAWPHAAPAD